MALPSPSRVAVGALIRLYLVPRPPAESAMALQGGPVVEALAACAAALEAGRLTPEQVRRGATGATRCGVRRGASSLHSAHTSRQTKPNQTTIPPPQSTAQAVFILEAIEAVGQAREEAAFTGLLAKLGRACPVAGEGEQQDGQGREGPEDPMQRLLPRCLRAVLHAASDSPDDLLTLLALLKEALAPPPMPSVDGALVRPTHVEGDSVFGIFLRQLLLECNSMAFETLASYLEEVRVYVRGPACGPAALPADSPAAAAATAAVAVGGKDGSTEEDGGGGAEAPHPFWGVAHSSTDPHSGNDPAAVAAAVGAAPPPYAASARQAQQYLQRRALDLEGEMGTQTFGEVEGEVERLLARHPELPRGQFLRFLNSCSHREFAGALDAAHRYFDYALRRYVWVGGKEWTNGKGSSPLDR